MSHLELRRLWYLDGRKMALWSEPSRRRLRRETRTISQILLPHIPRSCTHVRGHGGVKGALRQIQRRIPKAKFVARFDIAAYYTSMRHDVIEVQVAATDLDAHQRGLIADYLALPDMRDTGQGMVASGGLSPLLGALYLTPLDRRMDRLCKRKGLVGYVRYMDDIVLLARTRWQLRRAIAALHEEIAALGLRLHRIKRFIGRTTQGFDFLGYQIRAGQCGLAANTARQSHPMISSCCRTAVELNNPNRLKGGTSLNVLLSHQGRPAFHFRGV